MKPMLVIPFLLAALLPALGCGDGGRPDPSGTLEAVDVDISPRFAGEVLRVGPREGDTVAAGDTLLVIDTELIRLQRAEAEAAVVGVAARRAAASAELAQVRRSLELAATTLERLAAMGESGSATVQQVDEARAQHDILSRKVAAARQNVGALDAEAERIRAQIAVQDRRLADGTVLAPLAATVLLRTVEPGEMAAPGQVALRLADLRRLELRFYLDETDLDLVSLGRELSVSVDAFPDRTFTGKVSWISREAEFTPKNAQTRDARSQLVYAVKLELPNPDGDFAIGMPAEVKVGR